MYNHNIHSEKVILFICLYIKNIIMQSNNPSWQSESFFLKKSRYIKKEFKKSNNQALICLLCFARWHWFIPTNAVICKSISWSMLSWVSFIYYESCLNICICARRPTNELWLPILCRQLRKQFIFFLSFFRFYPMMTIQVVVPGEIQKYYYIPLISKCSHFRCWFRSFPK